MFEGAREPALDAARRMVARLPEKLDQPIPMESYLFVPVHVMLRFGMWEPILAEPAPGARYAVATALWHHARAVAYANSGRIDAALAEAARFEETAAAIPATQTVRRTKVGTLMAAARNMMNGEIRFKQGRHDEAFAALRSGVEAEDSMPYAEPPVWMQPVRHSLGALLLEAGRVADAEAVYREDLQRHADNVWSLHGLAECLRRRGREAEAGAVARRFEAASRHADVTITASCYCRAGARASALAPGK
jgi:tetratricopeptide (TPR) repeat protein